MQRSDDDAASEIATSEVRVTRALMPEHGGAYGEARAMCTEGDIDGVWPRAVNPMGVEFHSEKEDPVDVIAATVEPTGVDPPDKTRMNSRGWLESSDLEEHNHERLQSLALEAPCW